MRANDKRVYLYLFYYKNREVKNFISYFYSKFIFGLKNYPRKKKFYSKLVIDIRKIILVEYI